LAAGSANVGVTPIVKTGFRTLGEGERVRYDVRQGEKGLEVFSVRVIE